MQTKVSPGVFRFTAQQGSPSLRSRSVRGITAAVRVIPHPLFPFDEKCRKVHGPVLALSLAGRLKCVTFRFYVGTAR